MPLYEIGITSVLFLELFSTGVGWSVGLGFYFFPGTREVSLSFAASISFWSMLGLFFFPLFPFSFLLPTFYFSPFFFFFFFFFFFSLHFIIFFPFVWCFSPLVVCTYFLCFKFSYPAFLFYFPFSFPYFPAILSSFSSPCFIVWSFCTSISMGICFISLDFRDDIFGNVFICLHFQSVDLDSLSRVLSIL